MTFVLEDVDPAGLERKRPGEATDIDEIVRGMLAIQAQNAASGKRPLSRGTHAKGLCLRAEFEVFDIRKAPGEPSMADRLAKGIFARPGTYPAIVRFANADGGHRPDRMRDVVFDRGSSRRPGRRHASRLLDEQRQHLSNQ